MPIEIVAGIQLSWYGVGWALAAFFIAEERRVLVPLTLGASAGVTMTSERSRRSLPGASSRLGALRRVE